MLVSMRDNAALHWWFCSTLQQGISWYKRETYLIIGDGMEMNVYFFG